MSNIILTKTDKLDFNTTTVDVELADNPLNLTEDKTYILEPTVDNIKAAKMGDSDLFVPVTAVSTDDIGRVKVYFDLENYPFYQVAKEIIAKDKKPKGVFRFRRTANQGETDAVFSGDLFVLTSLLGETESIQIKRTNRNVFPSHTIVMIDFGGGTMAHLEYTISDHERIELEWSGEKQIIEFDSDEMRGIQPGNLTKLPLIHSVDAVLDNAHEVDEELMEKLSYFKKLLSGGAR